MEQFILSPSPVSRFTLRGLADATSEACQGPPTGPNNVHSGASQLNESTKTTGMGRMKVLLFSVADASEHNHYNRCLALAMSSDISADRLTGKKLRGELSSALGLGRSCTLTIREETEASGKFASSENAWQGAWHLRPVQ